MIFKFSLILLLAAFNVHHQANANGDGDQFDVGYETIGKTKIYKFMKENAAFKFAEILVKATLFSELKEWRQSLDEKLELSPNYIGNINAFFKSFAEKNGKNGFNNVLKVIEKQFENIKKENFPKEKVIKNEKERTSLNRIFVVAKILLDNKMAYYSEESKSKLLSLYTEYKKKKFTEEILVEKCKENTVEMTKRLYYAIYKYALAYVLISEGMPHMKEVKSEKVKALTTYTKHGMGIGLYLIYWLNTIMHQLDIDPKFELSQFDPFQQEYEIAKIDFDSKTKVNGHNDHREDDAHGNNNTKGHK